MQDSDLTRVDETDQALLLIDARPPLEDALGAAYSAIVTGQLSGTFLRASSPDIICYRRNFFHVRGTIIVRPSADVGGAATDAPPPRSITIRASLTARESLRGDEVTIHAYRKPLVGASSVASEPSPEVIETTVNLDSAGPTAVPVSWSRLQFRTATTKGGRRRDKFQDQHFRLHLRVFASLENGPESFLAEKCSGPIIVRGRSPGSYPSANKAVKSDGASGEIDGGQTESPFQERPDLPLKDVSKIGASVNEGVSGGGAFPVPSPTYEDLLDFDNLDHLVSASGHNDFGLLDINADDIALAHAFSPSMDLIDPETLHWDKSDDLLGSGFTPCTQGSSAAFSASLPILEPSLSDAANVNNATSISDDGKRFPAVADEPSPFYTYIPLGPDDRTPPVQAVYQPHGAHHKVSLPKTLQGNSKRYFGEMVN